MLLYRGSRDGFKYESVKDNCFGKNATITIIISEHNKIFGGFTSLSWKHTDTQYNLRDDKAFLFSLTNKTKHSSY
jgi:hypothetical protein